MIKYGIINDIWMNPRHEPKFKPELRLDWTNGNNEFIIYFHLITRGGALSLVCKNVFDYNFGWKTLEGNLKEDGKMGEKLYKIECEQNYEGCLKKPTKKITLILTMLEDRYVCANCEPIFMEKLKPFPFVRQIRHIKG